jgi:hypothetical protein
MSFRVTVNLSVSLDGFYTGPNPGPGQGLGEGGARPTSSTASAD